MIPKDEQFYDQLINHLATKGKVKEDAGQGVLVLSEFGDHALSAPLRLHLTPETFGDHRRATEKAALEAYPQLHPREAEWWLFLTHLDEAVQNAAPGETELVLDDGRVTSRPA